MAVELTTVARPYAKALYQLATEKGEVQIWLRELALLTQISKEKQMFSLLKEPEVTWQNKLSIILDIVGEKRLRPLVKNFLTVLGRNRRFTLLPFIHEAYQNMILAEKHVKQATVLTAFKLSDKELSKIVAEIEARYQVKLKVKAKVDRELIGGFKIEFGDRVLDRSVKGKLDSLKRIMTH
jgi:ATP synthase F1, delta subunit